jgi:CheY-like chemotaxis protein
MRVLVVDDDSGFRAEFIDLLRDAGHRAAGASSASRAVRALEREPFDIMFTDVRLRRQSGIELLGRARETWPRLLVVMLTGNATVETAIRALQLGAFDYLRKPVTADQVHRVLDLASQQIGLTRMGAQPIDADRFASNLAATGKYEVLLITPPPFRSARGGVTRFPLDPVIPFRIPKAVEEFVSSKRRAAVVLAAADQLLARHREEEIASLLGQIRAIMEGKGPFAVGYDPDRITATGALAIRASIVSTDAHRTIKSLSNPIRRFVLRRLADGPCSFTQAMEAAHLDDTALIAFHLRTLTEGGLVAHVARERYRLTSRGKGAVGILNSIDELDSSKGSGNRVFPLSLPKRITS